MNCCMSLVHKPPEWSNDGGVYPAQHLILLKTNQLFGTEDPWPCTKSSLKKQIRYWRSRMIARDLDLLLNIKFNDMIL